MPNHLLFSYITFLLFFFLQENITDDAQVVDEKRSVHDDASRRALSEIQERVSSLTVSPPKPPTDADKKNATFTIFVKVNLLLT